MPNMLVSSIEVGLELAREPEFIPETAFPNLLNAYCWRGRVRRRYGNTFLGRLRREFTSVSLGNLDGGGALSVNIFTLAGITESTASLKPGSVVVTIAGVPDTVLVENSPADGELTVSSGPITLSSSSLNYLTGALTIATSGAGNAVTVTFAYFPGLPATALPQRDTEVLNYEDNWAFDTTYAYLYNTSTMDFEEVNSTLATTWHGNSENLFWWENYENSFWATNGLDGLHFYSLSAITNANPGVFTTTANHNLSVNDPVVFVGAAGMVEINGERYLVNSTPTPTTFTVKDVTTGVALDTTAFGVYTGSGVVHTPTQNVGIVDGIRYYNPDVPTWVNFNPPVTTTEMLAGALIIIAYRGRLVALNTREGILNTGNQVYPQRARWSQNGTPYYTTPVPSPSTADVYSWRDDLFGRGGFVDAPTSEWIVSAGFVRDTLIVFFERSTWRLRYTGNEYQPFQWERVNTELGSESTFSRGLFDKGVLGVGDRGIISSDGIDTQRIDQKIPDEVFTINNANAGKERVYGVRDFIRRLFYWSYPNWNVNENQTFPNRIFVLNYEEGSWARFKDSITCFGEFQPAGDVTWEMTGASELAITWASGGYNWRSGVQQQQAPLIGAANQHGYVMLFQQTIRDGKSLYIQGVTAADPGILTIPDHNLEDGDYIQVINVISGATQVTAGVDTLTDINDQVFQVEVVDADNIYLLTLTSSAPPTFTRAQIAGTYIGGGEIVVRANFSIRSKRFNPYLDKDSKVKLLRTDFYCDTTQEGEFTYNLYVDANSSTVMNVPIDPLNTRSNVILTHPGDISIGLVVDDQDKTWYRNKDQVNGQFFQFELTLSPLQMLDDTIQSSDVTIHAVNFSIEPSGRLV